MKEAYSPYLLQQVLAELEYPSDQPVSILDPFAGSGTTATSALLLARGSGTRVASMEVNPFLALLSDVKMRCLSSTTERIKLSECLIRALPVVLSARRGPAPQAPPLAAFHNPEYFPPEALSVLLKMRQNLEALEGGLCRDILRVLLAACVEPISKLRKDGRALRYEANKPILSPMVLFEERVRLAAEDLRVVRPTGDAYLIGGSAMTTSNWNAVSGTDWDLCMFSPPYPNNIDYTEVYKLEAWFLGLFANHEGFRHQRRGTMRSHPSIMFDLAQSADVPPMPAVDRLADVLVAAVPRDRYRFQRERTIRGYLADSYLLMEHAIKKLRAGGHMVYVVGNSRHGGVDNGYTIASDVLLASLAESVGFRFTSLGVARDLHRRGRHDHLRESVVVLTKP